MGDTSTVFFKCPKIVVKFYFGLFPIINGWNFFQFNHELTMSVRNAYEQSPTAYLLVKLVKNKFFFFLSPAHTLCKIGHRFALEKGWLIFQPGTIYIYIYMVKLWLI